MNYEKACNILGIPIDIDKDDLSEEYIKKKYKRMALRYHPDKNRHDIESHTLLFQEVNRAYEYLIQHNGYYPIQDESDITDYTKMLFAFLKSVIHEEKDDIWNDLKKKLFYMVLSKISVICETKSIQLLGNLEKGVLIKIQEILKKYKDVFHLSTSFIEKMDSIILEKIKEDECIILHPFIDDLYENNLYKLTEKGGVFIVPLWHHELVYDNNGNDLIVKCCPILGNNIDIDENNNIHISLSYSIEELWGKDEIEFPIGKQIFRFKMKSIGLIPSQTIVLPNMGISKINTNEIYDITEKSDVVIHLLLHYP